MLSSGFGMTGTGGHTSARGVVVQMLSSSRGEDDSRAATTQPRRNCARAFGGAAFLRNQEMRPAPRRKEREGRFRVEAVCWRWSTPGGETVARVTPGQRPEPLPLVSRCYALRMSLKPLAVSILLLSMVFSSCGSGPGPTGSDGGECTSQPQMGSPCAVDQQSCDGPTVCRSCNSGLGLWALEPAWGCVCASWTVNGSAGLYWQCPMVPVCTLAPGTFADSQCTQPAITDGGVDDVAMATEDAPLMPEDGSEATSIVDGGGCSWPENLTPLGDDTAVGCWAHAVSGPVDGSQTTCSSAEYALGCVGEWPYSEDGGTTHATVPEPDPSLGCRILPLPTPINRRFYCCPCGQGR